MSTLINATDIGVRWNDRALLDGATLAIEEGEHAGLVGRNGSGKTTFLRILAGEQIPDTGSVTRRRDLVLSYLSQTLAFPTDRTVYETIRDGAARVLDWIREFESLPAQSPRHAELEHRISAVDGWNLDPQIHTVLEHLHCPPAERRLEGLSGGELRRVALARALVSRPDLLILDEPTNHLDPESIEWLAEFLEEFPGAFLAVTHDRFFLDRVARRMVELSEGRFFTHNGNYTDYLLARAERKAADAVIEHKRQMFLKKELAWVRQGPRAQRSKQKDRFERYYDTAAQEGPEQDQDMELCLPPPPPLGNRVVDLVNLGMSIGGRVLFRNFNFTFENGRRIGVTGRNGLGKTTLLRAILGELPPTEGEIKIGQLTRFNYVDQARVQLNDERTVLDELADGTEFVQWGEFKLSLRAYLRRFLFSDERISTQVKYLSGGERSRLLLARILKNGGNFLILDEPTNDLDLPTLRVLEEALLAFPGVVLAVSHDRYFLNRICTDIFALEGDGRVTHSVGDYDYYLEKKRRSDQAAARQSAAILHTNQSAAPAPKSAAPKPGKPRKLTFKETRELEGMESRILETERKIQEIEALFASPDFHRTHGPRTEDLKADLAAAKETLAGLYNRWEELEAIRQNVAG
ncbi:MAG: ABC-F family ATP-binding cassette domain-containing protein [Verrucomicrobiota bacterium]